MPVSPGARIEDARGRILQDFLELLRPHEPLERPEILKGSVGHDVREKVHGSSKSLGG